jgi:hypothetical protein
MMLDHALKFASRGWHVFPVQARGKHPLTQTGFREATDDPGQIARWWEKWRTANIGIACGASQIVVVDVDLPHGPESIRALDVHLPATLTQRTGSGGTQFFYKAPAWPLHNTAGRLPGVGKLLGVDLRADGGYVVVPPSIHPSGNAYEWVHNVWPEPCPDWLREAEKPRPAPEPYPKRVGDAYADAALDGECRKVQYALSGNRNNTLNEAAFALGQLIASGVLDETTVRERLTTAALHVGLDEREAAVTITSGLRAGMDAPRRVGVT